MTIRIPKWLVALLALLLAAGIGAGVALLASSGDEEPVRLVTDCRRPVERPREVITTCADANSVAERLDWEDWASQWRWPKGSLRSTRASRIARAATSCAATPCRSKRP